MANLKEASDSLIRSLRAAQAELDHLSHRLEEEFGERHQGQETNPLDLLKRIHKLCR